MVFDGSSSALRLRGVLARRPVALAALMLLAGAQARAQTDAAPQRLAQASTAALPAVTVTATLAEQNARTAPSRRCWPPWPGPTRARSPGAATTPWNAAA